MQAARDVSPPERSIPRRLFDLALPIIGLNVLAVLALAIDTAMCGRLPDAGPALAGLGFATQVIFLLMVAMMGLTVGSVALVARAHGAGLGARVHHLVGQATQLTVLVGLAVAVIVNLGAGWMVRAMGADAASERYAVEYLRPLLSFTVFVYLSLLLGGILRGVGNTTLPFFAALVSTAVNVVLNYGLILGRLGMPALGVAGAAWGTVVSQAIGVALLIFALRRGRVPGVTVPLRPRPIDAELARELFRVGAPAALDLVILNAALLSIVGMLARFDQAAVAAHGVGLRVQALAFVPGMSISQATGAMVGQALGAGDPARARRVLRASVVLCSAIMSSLALVIVFFARPLVRVFDVPDGTALFEYSVEWMRLLGYGMPLVGVYIAFVGLLQGAGATRISLAINFAATALVQIPLSAVLGFSLGWGSFGVWAGFPLSFVVKVGLGVLAYRRGGWDRVGASA